MACTGIALLLSFLVSELYNVLSWISELHVHVLDTFSSQYYVYTVHDISSIFNDPFYVLGQF